MNYLDAFPGRDELLAAGKYDTPRIPLKINNHIHTPFSFSAFNSVEEAVGLAAEEGISLLGINDFYVTDGYEEFLRACLSQRIFPLLNIELIGISSAHQLEGIRINDPNNPGRIYISGKGLAYPSLLSSESEEKLGRIIDGSNHQVSEMIELLNRWLEYHQTGITLSVGEIFETHARNLLRERHVAKALRIKIEDRAENDEAFFRTLQKIYGGIRSEKARTDSAGLENELRARLLKAGAPAFVPEDEKAFLPMEEIIRIIREAGGIPTYPLLLDGAGGKITEFENDREKLAETLTGLGFQSVEFIPLRNRIDILKEYAGYFYRNGFVVSFGTEHNTTFRGPLTVSCLEQVPLDEELEEISFNGAAFQAAHQYLVAKEGSGYEPGTRKNMETLGHAVLNHYFK